MSDLEVLLRQMDIPEFRRDVSKPDNVAWLLRNIQVRNSDNPFLREAQAILRSLMLNKRVAAVPKRYEHIDFKPPASVAKEAEKGLEYRRRSGKGGLSSQEAGKSGIGSGVQRAVNLKNRNNIAPDTIQQMLNFFSRHEKNKSIAPENRKTPWEDAGYVAWLLWGGDAGKSWAEGVKKQMEKADEEEKTQKTSSSPLRMNRDYGSRLIESWGATLPETSEEIQKQASEIGPGTSAGVFIPLPEDLALQFPKLSKDPSRPHVTLLVVGDVTGREDIFTSEVQKFFNKERGPILARLSGVDYFSPQGGKIAYSRVHFSTDMGALRDRLSSHLQDVGFRVENKFPLAYMPHVTLEYSEDPDFRWEKPEPKGSWSFHSVEIWGLPEISEIKIGPEEIPSEVLLRLQKKRASSEKLFREWFGV